MARSVRPVPALLSERVPDNLLLPGPYRRHVVGRYLKLTMPKQHQNNLNLYIFSFGSEPQLTPQCRFDMNNHVPSLSALRFKEGLRLKVV